MAHPVATNEPAHIIILKRRSPVIFLMEARAAPECGT
jgi:hypothetical protein